MNVEAIKRKAYDWLADVITACNKGDRDELKALMEHVISGEEHSVFNTAGLLGDT